MIKKIVISSCFFLFSISVWSQKELVVYRGAKMHRTVLPPEEKYVFTGKDNQQFSGYISQLLDSAVVINQDTLYLHDIKKIHTTIPRRGQRFIGELLFKGGIFLTIIDPLNNLINNDKPYIKRPGIIGLISIPVGYFMLTHTYKTFKIKRRTYLRIVQFD